MNIIVQNQILPILQCYYRIVIVVLVFVINVNTVTAFTIPTTTTTTTIRSTTATTETKTTTISPLTHVLPSLSIYSKIIATTTKTTTVPSRTSTSSTSLCMFTGIVEEIGTVVKFIERTDMTMWDGTVQKGYEMTIQCNNNTDATTSSIILDDAYIGCSICVSGVCLTVTEYNTNTNTFVVGIAPETMKCTYFPLFLQLQQQDAQQDSHAQKEQEQQYYVNLERAAPIGGRNSGHTVQGHVDCTGTIQNKIIEGNTLKYTIQLDDDDDSDNNEKTTNLISCIVPKGYVCIDGTSLTVIDVNYTTKSFTFMLIEYTQKHIIIPYKNIHDKVNIEVDVLAKYAQQVQEQTSTTTTSLYLQQLEKRIQVLEEALLIRNDK